MSADVGANNNRIASWRWNVFIIYRESIVFLKLIKWDLLVYISYQFNKHKMIENSNRVFMGKKQKKS